MDVSVLILNYNTRELTLQAIRSVRQSVTDFAYEIVLVDNASTDGAVEAVRREFPDVAVIVNDENVGFARANNQAIRVAEGRYVLLLNSDTVVQTDTLDIMIRHMDEQPEVGASGCKVVLPNGTLDKACLRGFPTPEASFYYAFGFSKLFPGNPRFSQYQLNHLNPDLPHRIDCLVGAFMLVRREAIEQVGVLDETFFMYGEDIDWCYRIKEAGWDISYYPLTRIIHYKGASSRRKPAKIIYEFYRAMWVFHQKHYRKKYAKVVNFSVFAGISLKFALAITMNAWRRGSKR
ncbi:glycosyltransferase family 2 protein [Paenibacillus sp. MBLB4367]|uniref:glycosyltransferase family 2 protein n=1 Tax=Paenibacillus sp. MBLB4367 TaxID=3384767 RepID=UPI00390817F3